MKVLLIIPAYNEEASILGVVRGIEKAGYDYVGYALYLPLFMATAAGLGAGAIAPFRRIASLQEVIPREIHRLIWLALVGFGLFYGLGTWLILRSNLILLGS